MPLIEVPHLLFGDWTAWRSRPRPSQDFDVPEDFGILGLYILAKAEVKPGESDSPNTADLPEEVVYIGMSSHVDRRLERNHQAVVRYKTQHSDMTCKQLWFALWRSEWSNMSPTAERGVVASATLALYERALILMYARKYGRLPALNRE